MSHITRLFCAFLAVFASVAFAQNSGTGIYTFSSFDTKGLDSINLGNLNTHFEIPITNKQGRGLNFNYVLAYDGLVWSQTTSSGTGYWQHDSSWGFHGRLGGAFTGYITYSSKTVMCPPIEGSPQYGYQLSNYVYHDPYGGNHRFGYSIKECDEAEGYPKVSGTGSTSDGSGLSYGVDTGIISTRSGSLIVAPENVGVNQSSYGRITDSNGNAITNNGNGIFTDTLGITALTIGGGAAYGNPLTYTYPVALQADSATTAAITVYFKTYSIKTNFQCPGISEYGAINFDLIDHITFPDAAASTYTFSYEATPGVPGAVTGRLASITLPTGGTISYTYSGGCNNSGINADGTPATLTRTTTDGSKTYARTIGGALSTTTTVDEKLNSATYSFTSNADNFWFETERQIKQGSGPGTLLQDRITQYNGQTTPALLTSAITQTDVLESFNGGSQSKVENAYNSSGLLTSSSRSDPSSGGSLGYDIYSYGSVGQITGIVSHAGVSGFPIVSAIAFGYDESTPTATSGIPQHSAPSGARGNLTSTHISLASGTIDSTATYYDTGVPVSTATPNGTTQYGYDSTQTFASQVTLPTSSSGIPISTSASYDQQSGVQISATGPNPGQITQIGQYDRLLRPIAVSAPDGGQTTYSYAPTQLGAFSKIDATHTSDQETFYDNYGRIRRSAIFNGTVWYLTDYCYDATGLLRYKSAPYSNSSNSGSQVCSGETYTYDALGRLTNVTHTDGTSDATVYSSRAVKVSSSQGVAKITQYDLLGRISAICEISSNASMPGSGSPQACGMDIAGTGFLTSYTYDLANHKTSIAQGGQARVFQTDAAGRTTYTLEPERGATTYTYAYNSTGLSVIRTRPKANQISPTSLTTTTTQYDSLGRIVSITYDDSLTPSRNYAYDQASNWGVNLGQSKGQLTYAWTGGTWTGTQFVYDVMGRILQSEQCLPGRCGNASFDVTQSYSYDLSGKMIQSRYLMSANSGTLVNTNYAVSVAGQITSISNTLTGTVNDSGVILSNIQNGPTGPTNYQFGNGLDGVNTYDSSGRLNGGWVCSGSTQFECGGGTQLYGNLASQQGSQISSIADTIINSAVYFGYDEFNRVTSANYTGPQNVFTYGYDRWGNRWSQNVTQGSGPAPQFTFNTATNQISGYTYDAAGNMTNDGFHSYTYDAEGNILKVDGGSTATYVYDALNHRVQSIANGANQEYAFNLSGQRASVWDGASASPSLLSATTYWNGRPVSFYNGATYFQHQDVLGTERLRTASDGSVAGSYQSLVFGDGKSASGADSDSYHFAQLDHDSESDTDHAQFRQYSPAQGRWLSPDPYDGSYDVSDPQSFNRYSYVENNPLLLTDPTGQCETISSGPGWIKIEYYVCDFPDKKYTTMTLYEHQYSFPDLSFGSRGDRDPQSHGSGAPNNGRNCSAGPASAGQYVAATAEVATLTSQYASGLGPGNRIFGPGTATSAVMGQSAGVQDVLNSYYMTGQTSGLYTFGAAGAVSAGGNPVAQFVGSFRWSISGGNLSLTNTTSFRSLTYDMGPQWQRSSFAPGGNTHQTYQIQLHCGG